LLRLKEVLLEARLEPLDLLEPLVLLERLVLLGHLALLDLMEQVVLTEHPEVPALVALVALLVFTALMVYMDLMVLLALIQHQQTVFSTDPLDWLLTTQIRYCMSSTVKIMLSSPSPSLFLVTR